MAAGMRLRDSSLCFLFPIFEMFTFYRPSYCYHYRSGVIRGGDYEGFSHVGKIIGCNSVTLCDASNAWIPWRSMKWQRMVEGGNGWPDLKSSIILHVFKCQRCWCKSPESYCSIDSGFKFLFQLECLKWNSKKRSWPSEMPSTKSTAVQICCPTLNSHMKLTTLDPRTVSVLPN